MGRSQVLPDWTFTVDGVLGICVARFNGGIARWTAKAITYDGKDLMDQPIAFTTGQQLRDVEVVFTDKRTELAFHVVDERGEPTREFVALVFPVDKTRWTENSRYVRPFVPPPELPPGSPGAAGSSGSAAGSGGSANAIPGASASAPRRDVVSNLPAGDYYVVALDDLDSDVARDAELLEQLARGATRVTLAEGATVEASVHRVKMSR